MPYRYKRFGEWIRDNSSPIKMPTVCLCTKGEVSFNDGRHRFAWSRDHGIQVMPIMTDPESAARFKARFGTGSRQSELPIPIFRTLNDKLLADLSLPRRPQL